jgi:predicted nucleic acid-binding protein
LTPYVLDASVAAKWFLPALGETLSAHADRLLKRYVSAEADFLVPDLFFAEFAKIFWKAEQRGRCNSAIADAAIEEITGRNFPAFPSASLIVPATQIARAYHRTVYDCIYVALAVQTSSEMVTADQKLAQAVGGHLPVRWLGEL